MRHVVLLAALGILLGCKSDPVDCRDLGLVEGDRDNCVCPEPLVPTDDRASCVCPAGSTPSGDTCVEADAGPNDAGLDAPAEDGCAPITLYEDRDRDGRGDPDSSRVACVGLAGFVDNADDCDDSCNTCWEGATETCDEADNDCDGFVDEGVRELVGDPINLTASAPGGLGTLATHRLALHALNDGGWLAFYVDDSLPDVLSSGVARVQRLSGDGTPIGEPMPVAGTTLPEHTSLTTAVLEDRILVAFAAGGAIGARVYDRNDGSALTPPRTLYEGPISNLRAGSVGTSFVLVWERNDRLVFQWRPSFLGDAVDVSTDFHTLATNPYLLASVWTVDDVGRPTLVFVDGGLRAAVFENPMTAPVVRELVPPWDLGDTDFADLGVGVDDQIAIASPGTVGFAQWEAGALRGVVIESAAALYGTPLLVDPGTFITRRVGEDGNLGVFLYRKREDSWVRSPLDLSGGTLNAVEAAGLVLFGQLQPDDREDAVVQHLACP